MKGAGWWVSGLKLKHDRLQNGATRHGPGNARGGHFKKGVVWGREGLESRSTRPQTRFDFSNLDPIDLGALSGAHAQNLAKWG